MGQGFQLVFHLLLNHLRLALHPAVHLQHCAIEGLDALGKNHPREQVLCEQVDHLRSSRVCDPAMWTMTGVTDPLRARKTHLPEFLNA